MGSSSTPEHSLSGSYEQLIRKHIVPALGRIRLKALAPAQVRGLLRDKLVTGLSPRTVQYIRFVLRKALDQAVRDNMIPRNPAASIKSPQVRREQIKPLSPEQSRLFLPALAYTRAGAERGGRERPRLLQDGDGAGR